jgi:serine protease Do
VGILPGDIVTSLEGLVLSTDGTLADYCDILRSNGPDDVMAVEVLRNSTQEYLEGRINDSPLQQSFSFAAELDDEVADPGTAYTDYVSVSDDSGAITVDVPAAWSDVDGRPREGEPSVAAAPSVDDFFNTWDTPGMEVYATRAFTGADIDSVLDQYSDLPCDEAGERTDYEDPLYTGRWVFYSGCGGTDTGFLTLVSTPESGDFVIIVVVQVLADADFDAIDRILNTFVVDEGF